MNDNLRISPVGLKLIRESEGLFLKAYRCPAGVLTIGYGSTNRRGKHPELKPGLRITKEQAEAMLLEDLIDYENDIKRLVKVPLTQNQFDALVSWQFNTGALAKSTLLKVLNKGNYAAVPAQLMLWTKATVDGKKVELKGLVTRRRAEAALWRDMPAQVIQPPLGWDMPLPQEVAKPDPTPVTNIDKVLEVAGAAAPVVTALGSAFADWKIAAVIAGSAVVGVVALAIINRRTD